MESGLPTTTRAVAYLESLPIEDPRSLIDVDLPMRPPGDHDLLVRVEAVSVNPVDVKVRVNQDPGGDAKVLGYDAAGVVEAVGDQVSLFGPGDQVFYAGSIARPGTNMNHHLVDERIVGPKPVSLTFAAAAALPLTSITAWETLFRRFAITPETTATILVMAAGGGVGSMLVQLARTIPGLTVIATASRPESQQWARDLGAHHIVDHHAQLAEQVRQVAPAGVEYIFSPYSRGNLEAFAQVLKPRGQITAIDDPGPLDLKPLKPKSISWHWEYMFTSPLFDAGDSSQHELLKRVAAMVDDGTLRTTLTEQLGPISAQTLREAHARVESRSMIGKIVVAGF
jgi:zinc-binding alcohol dehydrogenase family protein